MITDARGYIFEARRDVLGNYGLMESYKLMEYKGMHNVFLTFAIDNAGKPICPSYMDIGEGFKSLKEKIVDDDVKTAMEKYVKSNKPTIANLKDVGVIVDGKFSFDLETGVFKPETSNFDLYSPVSILDNIFRNASYDLEPGICCEKLSTKKELNSLPMDINLYNSYITNILKYVRKDTTIDRVSFLVNRVQ